MIQSSISLSLEVQPCIKNELHFRNRRHHKRVKTNGQAWDKAPNFAPPGTTWVTSVSRNGKFTPSPVSQVLYRSNFGGKSRAGRIQIIFDRISAPYNLSYYALVTCGLNAVVVASVWPALHLCFAFIMKRYLNSFLCIHSHDAPRPKPSM